jgi:hypothetical protein
MPQINQLPVITTATINTYFVVSDNGLARRLNFAAVAGQLTQGSSSSLGTNGQPVSLANFIPTSSSSPGTAGQMAADTSTFYICIAANTWRRVALSAF